MAKSYLFNPRRKKKSSKRRNRRRNSSSRAIVRTNRRRRRRNCSSPGSQLAIRPSLRRNPSRRRNSSRRRNPLGLGKLIPTGGVFGQVVGVATGFFATKALSLVLHKDWTANVDKDNANSQVRQLTIDAAVSATAIALGYAARALRVAKGSDNPVLTGGLFFALHRGIRDRVLQSTAVTGFGKDLLTDYLNTDGGHAFDDDFDADLGELDDFEDDDDFDDDLGHFGNQGAFLDDYVTVDDVEGEF